MSDFALNRGIGGHHRAYRGRTDDWLTPPPILKALGPFDLDPCCPAEMPWPTATTMYCHPEQDGLELPWAVRVWMNPPYGPMAGKWLKKLARHGNGIALIFARTETEMFHKHAWDSADAMLFLRGRINFYDVAGNRAKLNAGGPSVLIAYGGGNSEILKGCGISGKFVRLKDQ